MSISLMQCPWLETLARLLKIIAPQNEMEIAALEADAGRCLGYNRVIAAAAPMLSSMTPSPPFPRTCVQATPEKRCLNGRPIVPIGCLTYSRR